MSTWSKATVILAFAGALGASTFGQERFEPVEGGVADADPLAVGLRELQVDLRDPVGFEQVFRVPGRDDLLMRVDGGLFAIFPRSVYVDSRSGIVPVIPNNTTFFIGEPIFDLIPRVGDSLVPGPGPGKSENAGPRRASRLDERLSLRSRRADALGLRLSRKIRHEFEDDPSSKEAPTDVAAEESPVVSHPRPQVESLPAAEVVRPATEPDPARWRARVHELMRRAAAAAQAARGPSSSSS